MERHDAQGRKPGVADALVAGEVIWPNQSLNLTGAARWFRAARSRCRGPGKLAVPLIGIGGSLAAPPLPHHRAYGSVPRRFDRVRRLTKQPGEEGRASRSTRCAAPVGPPGDWTCATRLWVSRLQPPPQTQARRDFVAEQSVSALSATAATGTCAIAYVSTHRDWTTPAAFDRSRSSPAIRSSNEPTARSPLSDSPRVSDTSAHGLVP